MRIFTLITILLAGVLLATACSSTVDPSNKISAAGQIEDVSLIDLAETASLTPADMPTSAPEISPTTANIPLATSIPSLTPIPTATPTDPPLTPTSSPTITATPIETASLASPTATKPAPLPTPSGVYSWTLKVPILMYHYISVPPEDADKYRVDLSVSPEDFRRQMEYLAQNGYQTIDLYDLSLAITAKRDLPEKPIILTFDDGYRDNYENAFPVLQEFGLEATFFVVTEFIDQNQVNYLTWEMVEEMAKAGMRIESHSKTHPDLSGQERDYVIYEILGSQETIAAHIGYKPLYFCYPGGFYDETTIQVLQELNFWGALTTAAGEWHGFNNRFEWDRLRIRNTTTLSEFSQMIDTKGTKSGKYEG